MRLTALRIADPPERWAALGFAIDRGQVGLAEVTLVLGGNPAWSLPPVDGLASFKPFDHAPLHEHPNGAIGLDHVVVTTPDFDRTAAALAEAELPLKRIRDAGGFRQGFRRVGEAILELVEVRGEEPSAPARFWGLVPVVADLDALKARLGEQLSDPKPAVQPGRRIATLREGAGLGCAVAFMDAAA